MPCFWFQREVAIGRDSDADDTPPPYARDLAYSLCTVTCQPSINRVSTSESPAFGSRTSCSIDPRMKDEPIF